MFRKLRTFLQPLVVVTLSKLKCVSNGHTAYNVRSCNGEYGTSCLPAECDSIIRSVLTIKDPFAIKAYILVSTKAIKGHDAILTRIDKREVFTEYKASIDGHDVNCSIYLCCNTLEIFFGIVPRYLYVCVMSEESNVSELSAQTVDPELISSSNDINIR